MRGPLCSRVERRALLFAGRVHGDYSSGSCYTRVRVTEIGSKFIRVPGRAATSLGPLSSGPRPSCCPSRPSLLLPTLLSHCLSECVLCPLASTSSSSSSPLRLAFSHLSSHSPVSRHRLPRYLPLSAAGGKKIRSVQLHAGRILARTRSSPSFSRANNSHGPRVLRARSVRSFLPFVTLVWIEDRCRCGTRASVRQRATC